MILIGFGKYEDKTIREVLKLDPLYINWCAIKLDHFYITDEVLEEMKSILSGRCITEEAKKKLLEKYKDWKDDQNRYNDYDYAKESFYALTDGQYGNYEDFSDMDNLRDGLGF